MAVAAEGLLTLTGLREHAAQALAPRDETEPPVLHAPVDAISPPALMLAWEDPWLTFRSACLYEARLAVVCFVGRVEPDAGVAELEGLVGYVTDRLRADSYPWPHDSTRAPRQFEVGGVPLLSARIVYRSPVAIGGA